VVLRGNTGPRSFLYGLHYARSVRPRPGANIPQYGPRAWLVRGNYYIARQIRAFWLVLSWSGFCHTDRFRGNGHKLCIFCFRKPANSKQAWPECHIINCSLTVASSSRTGEDWPSVVYVRTSLRSVRTATTSGQYSPVRPSRSVSKRLIFYKINRNCLYLFGYANGTKVDKQLRKYQKPSNRRPRYLENAEFHISFHFTLFRKV